MQTPADEVEYKGHAQKPTTVEQLMQMRDNDVGQMSQQQQQQQKR